MSKVDRYREIVRRMRPWDAALDAYLVAESGLPGPRGNLELAQAVAAEGDRALFERYLTYDAGRAPTNSPQEFLAFCGVLGLGTLLARGERDVLGALRGAANDSRWRTREAVAMALQRWGAIDMPALLDEMRRWAKGTFLEGRAAAAALCEPSLLRDADHVRATLEILDALTAALPQARDRRSEGFRALRKGLGYCWSVAVAAAPELGLAWLERWMGCEDPDVHWLLRENLRKKRLERAAPEWVAARRQQLG